MLATDAYKIMKRTKDFFIPYIEVTDDHYIFEPYGNGYETVNKKNGKIDYLWRNEYFDLLDKKKTKPVFVYILYDDFLEKYNSAPSESCAADLFARAWNHLQHIKMGKYDCTDNEMKRIYGRWLEVSTFLRSEIDSYIDWKLVSYPPSIRDRLDDEYYRLKPFMVRNGYTTSMYDDRCWYAVK